MLRIRRARLADAAALARVHRATVRGLARGAYTERQISLWTRLGPLYYAWALGAGGEIAFVAERGGRVLRFAAHLERRRAEVTELYERPAAAGGGGVRALARVEAEARRRGIQRLVVKASLNGAPFYRARGYARPRPSRVPLPDGASLDALLLTKTITAARTGARTGSGGSRLARRAAGTDR
jgi:putative acetyltransferase